jgi:hypothetical protein
MNIRPRLKRRLKLAFLILCALVMLAGTAWVVRGTFLFIRDVLWKDEQAQTGETLKPAAFCGCTRHSVRFKRDPYDLHRHHAHELNKGVMVTEAVVSEQRLLTKVEDGKGYRIDHRQLTHSVPYLHPEAYKVLREMGRSYAERIKGTDVEGSDFRISSLTRTSEQQEKLRKSAKGVNATPNVSTHSYGASFDIYRFANAHNCGAAQKIFGEVLLEFQQAGRILLTPEGNCVHVTVRNWY